MTPVFVLIAVAGWVVVVVLAYYVANARRELRRVREATHAAEDVALVEAITETERESADRVARAEAVQHWLLAALDEATDAIVVVTHNMQQAARVSDMTAFMTTDVDDSGRRTGRLVEYDDTDKMFTNPTDPRTEGYITGRFG